MTVRQSINSPRADSRRNRRSPLRGTLVGSVALAGAALLAVAVPMAAQAHVTVNPGQASAGSYTTLTFKVPNESATAGTVKLEVDLPADTPFTSVSYLPVPGWSAQITTSKLDEPVTVHGSEVNEAPSKIVWTAQKGVQVAPGQFQQFVVSAGPVPDTGKVQLPTTQTYSDGTVVKWDEAPGADGSEPQHPAPVLYINDAPTADHHDDDATVTPSAPAENGADSGTTANGSGSAAGAISNGDAGMWLGLGGVVLGAIALVVAVFALVRKPGAK